MLFPFSERVNILLKSCFCMKTNRMREQMDDVLVPIQAENESCIPYYGSKEAAGADIKANVTRDLAIEPGERVLIPTGIRMEIPRGYEVQIRPRSGLALKHGVTLVNTPATIDSDYRGEIKVLLINHGEDTFYVKPGMRIAQILLAPVFRMHFVPAESLQETARGAGGFGHTGME